MADGSLTGKPERVRELRRIVITAPRSLNLHCPRKTGEGGVSGTCAAGLRASPRDCELLAIYLIINRLAKVARQAPEGPEAPEPVALSNDHKMLAAGVCTVTAEPFPGPVRAGASFLYTKKRGAKS